MEYELDTVRTLTRLRLRDTAEVNAGNGRTFIPNTVVFNWVWRRRQGWTWTSADVSGLLVADEDHPHVPGLHQRVSYRAVPADAPPGDDDELPEELAPLVDVSRPDWTPPAECSECGTPVNVAQQYNQQSGEVVPLCPACHHEAVSGT